MKKISFMFLFLIVFLFFTGCVTRMLDFTIVSSKNVDLRVEDTARGPRVTGEDFVWWVFSIPLGTPSLEEAVDLAIESAGPGYDALMDGVIYSKFYYYVFFAKSGYIVEGTPIKTSELIAKLKQEDDKDITNL